MEKKKSTNVLLFIMGLLIVVEIAARAATIQNITISAVAHLLSLLFVALYGFGLYKKPHGNMLKYALLLFALANMISGCIFLLEGFQYEVARILASAAVCYCAGRLDRIDQNKYLLPIIGAVYLVLCLAVAPVYFSSLPSSFIRLVASFNNIINYITIMIAYFVRYKEHKEAGLADAPKAK